jgi:hypothetical protein
MLNEGGPSPFRVGNQGEFEGRFQREEANCQVLGDRSSELLDFRAFVRA